MSNDHTPPPPETPAERLARIKERWAYMKSEGAAANSLGALTWEDIDHLIEQAEKVQGLEAYVVRQRNKAGGSQIHFTDDEKREMAADVAMTEVRMQEKVLDADDLYESCEALCAIIRKILEAVE